MLFENMVLDMKLGHMEDANKWVLLFHYLAEFRNLASSPRHFTGILPDDGIKHRLGSFANIRLLGWSVASHTVPFVSMSRGPETLSGSLTPVF